MNPFRRNTCILSVYRLNLKNEIDKVVQFERVDSLLKYEWDSDRRPNPIH